MTKYKDLTTEEKKLYRRERDRAYYRKNKDKMDKRTRLWRKNNNTEEWRKKECERVKEWLLKNPDYHTEYMKEYRKRPDVKKKCSSRVRSSTYFKGEKHKCSECSANENIERHHPDYNDPLTIVWLCRKCHYDLHRKMKLTN